MKRTVVCRTMHGRMDKIFAAATVALVLLAPACGRDSPSTPKGPSVQQVEALVAGLYRSWYRGHHSIQGPSLMLSSMAFQHSATAPDHGMLYSQIPRVALVNAAGDAHYGNLEWTWQQHHATLGSVVRALQWLSDTAVVDAMDPAAVARAQVVVRLVQALALADIALLYDRGYAVDQATPLDAAGNLVLTGEPTSYNGLMLAGLARFDEVIALANAAPQQVVVPKDWLGTPTDVSMETIRRLSYSSKAIYRANVPRTPAERAAVNWTTVRAELAAGLKADFVQDMGIAGVQWLGENHAYTRAHDAAWQQLTYFMLGMADASGQYQQWLALPLANRAPFVAANGSPVLIVTADNRFPQWATLSEQVNSWGPAVGIRRTGTPPAAQPANSGQFSRPENGTWRWSQYYHRGLEGSGGGRTATEARIRYAELRLLAAEAEFRLGNLHAAADSINVSRVPAGLSAANPNAANHGNSSCVPRLPNGACGGLFEMMKWEKRIETWQRGPFAAGWFFDGRGWGALYRGTPLQLPIPAGRLQELGLGASYTFGGPGGSMSAPQSAYKFPGE